MRTRDEEDHKKLKEQRKAELRKLGQYLTSESSIQALKTRPYVKKVKGE